MKMWYVHKIEHYTVLRSGKFSSLGQYYKLGGYCAKGNKLCIEQILQNFNFLCVQSVKVIEAAITQVIARL